MAYSKLWAATTILRPEPARCSTTALKYVHATVHEHSVCLLLSLYVPFSKQSRV